MTSKWKILRNTAGIFGEIIIDNKQKRLSQANASRQGHRCEQRQIIFIMMTKQAINVAGIKLNGEIRKN